MFIVSESSAIQPSIDVLFVGIQVTLLPASPFLISNIFCLPFRTSIFGCELFVLRVQMKLRMNGNYNNYQTVSPANAAVQHPLIQLDWDNNAKQRRMAFCLLIPPLTFGTG